MAGESSVRATSEQVRLLEAKAGGSDRAEADRDRSILFFRRLIDLRSEIKAELKSTKKRLKAITGQFEIASGADAGKLKCERESLRAKAQPLESDQQALKILANSTSYGIFVEMIVAELDAVEKLTCFGPGGEGFPVESRKIEEPGKYFTPCSRP